VRRSIQYAAFIPIAPHLPYEARLKARHADASRHPLTPQRALVDLDHATRRRAVRGESGSEIAIVSDVSEFVTAS
jgi:hypothetical protein